MDSSILSWSEVLEPLVTRIVAVFAPLKVLKSYYCELFKEYSKIYYSYSSLNIWVIDQA